MLKRRSSKSVKNYVLMAAVAVTSIIGLSACGSGSSSAASDTTASAAKYEVVSDADVATGLGEVALLAARATTESTSSVDTAKATIVEMYDKWYEFEGTIRANDQPMYLELEDGLAKFKIGIQGSDFAKAAAGLQLFSTKSAEYLTAHPAS
jgi:maltose-binding protein MalE